MTGFTAVSGQCPSQGDLQNCDSEIALTIDERIV